MKRIVRIRKVDLAGDKRVGRAITKIKGIDLMMSNAITHVLSIDDNQLLGELSEKDLNRLKQAIEAPHKLGIPQWLLNRRKDIKTGEDLHLTSTDITLTVREDIKRMKENRSRKGYRHAADLKVRGQRTKAHPRKGETVGVMTKKKLAKMMKTEGVKGKGGKAAKAGKGGKKAPKKKSGKK